MSPDSASRLPFLKMNGLGNDFLVLDGRTAPVRLTAAQIRRLADRRAGVGFDQMITLEPSTEAQAFMRIHNADGGEAEACGNAARCIAAHLMEEAGSAEVSLATASGIIHASGPSDGKNGSLISVDMGAPGLDWRDIPLAAEHDTLHLPIEEGPLADPTAVNMGNPHMVFFVEDAEAVDLAALGPGLALHALFPEGVNVSVATCRADGSIRLRVCERGAGITRACGTGACATRVAAARRNLSGRSGPVELDGGVLEIAWRDDGHVLMTGPAATTFSGTIDPALLAEDGS